MRWYCASQAVTRALKAYNTTDAAGSWSHYYPMCSQNEFKLIHIYDYIKGAFGVGAASNFIKYK